MTEMKLGGLVLTGLGAYLILSKAIHAVNKSVADISDAIKWRAYYNCKRENPLAPHYTRTSHPTAKTEGLDDEEPGKKELTSSSKSVGKAVGDIVANTIDNLFKDTGVENDPLEGDSEASEDASETSTPVADDIPTIEQEEDEDE